MSRRMAVAAAGMALAVLAAGCGYGNNGGYGMGPGYTGNSQVVSGTGDLTTSVTEFRALLGDINGAPGEQPGGRREINWEGVTGALLNVNTFPGDQFNRVVPRGMILATPGTGLRVSDDALFDLEPTDSTQFSAFSGIKTFVPVGSPIVDVTFRVAGTDVVAVTSAFGVVFSDVDRVGSASLEFFDVSGYSLRKVTAPVRSDAAGHSFVGVVFDASVVARVRIVAGQAPVGPGIKDISVGGTADLVDTDDFIAGEPHPVQ
jgi:hypothetical protein